MYTFDSATGLLLKNGEPCYFFNKLSDYNIKTVKEAITEYLNRR